VTVLGTIGGTENSLETIDKPEHNLHWIRHVLRTNFRTAQCLRACMTVWTKQDAFSPLEIDFVQNATAL
jgi:hypothetical protein